MILFKITKKHIDEYSELERWDLGMYAIKINEERELMVYETKAVAEKALEYFKKTFKVGAG